MWRAAAERCGRGVLAGLAEVAVERTQSAKQGATRAKKNTSWNGSLCREMPHHEVQKHTRMLPSAAAGARLARQLLALSGQLARVGDRMAAATRFAVRVPCQPWQRRPTAHH